MKLTSEGVQEFWYWLNRGLWVAVVVAAALLMGGCATTEYWFKDAEPVALQGIQFTDKPCGLPILGCAMRVFGVIQIKSGMSPGKTACVIAHEKRHLEGWNHAPSGTTLAFAIDCGNGEMFQ